MDTIEELPPIDERLALPEAGYEIIDGVVTFVAPADPPHAERHLMVSVLVGSHAHADFKVAVDMLTRTSKIDDIAPDVSVFPRARHPVTGGRRLEELAFEIVSTESRAHATIKAEKLAGRGVRRVFAIDIRRERVLEWSRELGTWSVLDVHGWIEDPALAVPLSVNALLNAASSDDEVARALVLKQNPIIGAANARSRAEGLAEGLAEGRAGGLADGIARGRAEAVITLLTARGLAFSDEQRDRILAERDRGRLEDWLLRVTTCASVAELLAAS